MLRVVGAPAVGTAFFDREEITEKIQNRLNSGSLLLAAPRRFGKTSIMLKVKENLSKEGTLCIYLDIEWVNAPEDLIVEILCKIKDSMGQDFKKYVKGLPKGLIDSVKDNIENVELPFFKVSLKKELQGSWMEKGHELFNALRKINAKAVLFLDEFPLMLYNMCENKNLDKKEVLKLLYWLRSLRMETDVRMVLGGSIGVDRILKNLRSSASINDLERIQIEPFDEETAKKFVNALLASEGVIIGEKLVKNARISWRTYPILYSSFRVSAFERIEKS